MVKTTVYLPEALKHALGRVATTEGRSEAEIIRDAIRERVGRPRRRAPRLPLIDAGFGDPAAARRVDELLGEGFGR
ncbi:MAG: ribbon-helix-helix domain-containing protein [Actinomycetota bacterium]|nr:ribbon-helix-helix domain-containing protein [Actinomycetota bacterium]